MEYKQTYVRHTTTTTKMKQIQGGNKKINLFIQLKGNARKKNQQSTINYKLIAVYFLFSAEEKKN